MPKKSKQKVKNQKPTADLNPEYSYANLAHQNLEKQNTLQFLNEPQYQLKNDNQEKPPFNNDHWHQQHKINEVDQGDEDIDQYFDFEFNQAKVSKNKELQIQRSAQRAMVEPFSHLKNHKIDENQKLSRNGSELNSQEEGQVQYLQDDSSILVQSDSQSQFQNDQKKLKVSQNQKIKSLKQEVQPLIPLNTQMKFYDQDSIQKKKKDLMEQLVQVQERFQHQNNQKSLGNCLNQPYENLLIFKCSENTNLNSDNIKGLNQKKKLFENLGLKKLQQKQRTNKNNVTKFIFQKNPAFQQLKKLHSQKQAKQEYKPNFSKQKSSIINQKTQFQSQKIQNPIYLQKNNKSLRNTRSTINRRQLQNQKVQNNEQSNQDWMINIKYPEKKNQLKIKPKINFQECSRRQEQSNKAHFFSKKLQQKQSVNSEINGQMIGQNFNHPTKINNQNIVLLNIQTKRSSKLLPQIEKNDGVLVKSLKKQVKLENESQIQEQEPIQLSQLSQNDEVIKEKSQYQTYKLMKFSNQLQQRMKLISSMKNSMRIIMNYHKITTKNEQIVQYQEKVHQILKSQVNKLYQVLNQKQSKARKLIDLGTKDNCKYHFNKKQYDSQTDKNVKDFPFQYKEKYNMKSNVEREQSILFNNKDKETILTQNMRQNYSKNKAIGQLINKAQKVSCNIFSNDRNGQDYSHIQRSISQNQNESQYNKKK